MSAMLPLLLLCAVGAASGADSYGLVADAGSTGTRMYLFHVADGGNKVDVTDLGKGPALSSFKDRPEEAAKAVKPQLDKAAGLVPAGARRGVPVSIMATAGMRLVPEEAQHAIYSSLTNSILADASYAFDAPRFEARTISGREEGVFALVAANYLAKHLHVSMHAATGSLMGVLDLGGSSTQVAAPPSLSAGEGIAPKLGPKHTFVRSFLNLGMERMRNRTFARFVEQAPASLRQQGAVPNPCSFSGYAEGEELWTGAGEATACEAKVRAVLLEERTSCIASAKDPEDECLSADPVPLPKGAAADAKFFLISGYMYVTDFAAWLLRETGVRPEAEFARPTIAELREAAAQVCAQDWSMVQSLGMHPEKKHRFTQKHKLPHRCFEINYVVSLLSGAYGFKEEERLFNIVSDIDGDEIEWTLGAFLHGLPPHTGSTEL